MKPLAVHLEGKSMTLLPACCIHWPLTEKHLLLEWVDRLQATPDARGILMGDSLDCARSHYRNHIRSYRDDENSQEALDEYHRKEVRELAKILDPVKSKLFGAIRGNHFWEFSDGTNSEQYICQLLQIPYLGAIAMIRVSFHKYKSNKVCTLVIYAHHSGGSAGARTTGGDVAGMVRSEAGFDADIYLTGHTHRRLAHKETVLALTTKGEPRIVDRSRVFARCGSFLKGFRDDHPNTMQPHRPSYAEVRALRPTDLGWVKDKHRPDGSYRAGVDYPQYTLEY
jgi:hypothetical protein